MSAGAIHLVDDDDAFRTAIARLLRAHGHDVVEHPSAEHFLAGLDAMADGGCVLLDLFMPGLDGAELQQRLAGSGLAFAIVFLTGHADIASSVRAIKAGAEDFLTKPVPAPKLLDALERAQRRFQRERAKLGWMRAAQARLASLTPREREVFDYIVRGHRNKQTAYALGITERTIKAHRQRLFDKLGLQSAAELALFAERLGVGIDRPDGSPFPLQ